MWCDCARYRASNQHAAATGLAAALSGRGSGQAAIPLDDGPNLQTARAQKPGVVLARVLSSSSCTVTRSPLRSWVASAGNTSNPCAWVSDRNTPEL